jgi:hypothetical protein
MTTTDSIRRFALSCLGWAKQINNPSDRQHIVSAGKFWLATASTLERIGDTVQMPDLRSKLN